MDGRAHPADILDYPEWMGHSIGSGWRHARGSTRSGCARNVAGYGGLQHRRSCTSRSASEDRPDAIRPDDDDRGFRCLFAKAVTYGRNPAAMAEGHAADAARCADNERSLADAVAGRPGTDTRNRRRSDAVYRKAVRAFLLILTGTP